MTGFWRRLLQPFARPVPRLHERDWQAVVDTVALVRSLDPARRERLRTLVERFVSEKSVTPVAGL
jgi:MtfA peptidase